MSSDEARRREEEEFRLQMEEIRKQRELRRKAGDREEELREEKRRSRRRLKGDDELSVGSKSNSGTTSGLIHTQTFTTSSFNDSSEDLKPQNNENTSQDVENTTGGNQSATDSNTKSINDEKYTETDENNETSSKRIKDNNNVDAKSDQDDTTKNNYDSEDNEEDSSPEDTRNKSSNKSYSSDGSEVVIEEPKETEAERRRRERRERLQKEEEDLKKLPPVVTRGRSASSVSAPFEDKNEKLIRELKDEIKRLEVELDDAHDVAAHYEDEVTDLERRLKKYQSGEESKLKFQTELDNLEKKLEDAMQEKTRTNRRHMQEIDKLEDRCFSLEEQVKMLEKELEEEKDKVKALQQQQQSAPSPSLGSSGSSTDSPTIKLLQKQIDELEDDLDDMVEQRKQYKEKYQAALDEKLQLEEANANLEFELAQTKKKLKIALDSVESFGNNSSSSNNSSRSNSSSASYLLGLDSMTNSPGGESILTISSSEGGIIGGVGGSSGININNSGGSAGSGIQKKPSSANLRAGGRKNVLIQIKGKERIHVRQTELSGNSLNHSDAFILDAGEKIYFWNGSHCNRKKSTKGMNIANAINKTQRKGKSSVIIIEDGHEDKDFWQALGGKPKEISKEQGDDVEFENQCNNNDKLWRVNPGMELFRVDGQFTKDRLNSTFTYILDCYTEMYVWCGKKSNESRRNESIKKAKEMFQKVKRPPWAVLKKVVEGQEPILFQEKFWEWKKNDNSDSVATTEEEGDAHSKSKSTSTDSRDDSRHSSGGEDYMKQYDRTYTYRQLVAGEYPASLDTGKKEYYLSDEEFQRIFKMTKSEFYKQSPWKIKELKLQHKLF